MVFPGCKSSPEFEIMKEREAISNAIKKHSIDADSVLSKALVYLESGNITQADIIIGDLIWYYKDREDSLSIQKAYDLADKIGEIKSKLNNYDSNTYISNSSTYNKYYVNKDVTFAATTEENYDILMNCVLTGDMASVERMVDNGQVKYLHKNDIVFLVKTKFKCFIVRLEGSPDLYYVVGEHLTVYK